MFLYSFFALFFRYKLNDLKIYEFLINFNYI